MKKVLFLIVISLFFFNSCKKSSSPTDPTDNPNTNEIVLSAATKEPEKFAGLQSTTVDSNQIVFSFNSSNTVPIVQPGDILIGSTNNGYLRKVLSVTKQGNNLVVTTTLASVDEAYEKAYTDTAYDFTFPSASEISRLIGSAPNTSTNTNEYSAKFLSSKPIPKVSPNGLTLTLSFPNAKLEVKAPSSGGSISIEIDTITLSLSAKVKELKIECNTGLKSFRFVSVITPAIRFTNVAVLVTGKITKTDSIKLIPNPIPLGTYPTGIPFVVITPEIDILLGLKSYFSLSGGMKSETTSSYSVECELGLEYKDNALLPPFGTITPKGSTNFKFEPTGEIAGGVQIYLKPVISARINSLLGISLFDKGYGYINMTYPPTKAETGVGISAGIAADLKLFGKNLFYVDYIFADVKKPLFSQSAPLIPYTPSPTDKATNQQTNLTLSWNCSDPDNDPVKYDVYFGENSTPTEKVSALQTGKTYAVSALTNSKTYYWQIFAKDQYENMTSSPVWSFTTAAAANNPPAVPSSPAPTDGATAQSASPTLSWSCSDPDGDALTYDVYFGTSSNPTTIIATNQTAKSIGRTGLTASTKYYWKIVAKDSKAATTAGPVWSFTTAAAANNPPAAPSSPAPTDGATAQSTSPTLSWSCSDPDGDALTYDVYFGTSSNPTATIATNQTAKSIGRTGLTVSTKYYWKITAKDSKAATTSSPVWSFTTAAAANNPPTAPSSPAPTDGATGQSTSPTLSWSCSDPDGDALTYDVYFGTTSNPTTTIATNQTAKSIARSGLTVSTKYYWKITAKDSKAATTSGPVWSFTTTGSTTTASISGKVTNSSSQAINGVKVYTSPATSTVYSDASGNYAINNISAGTYTVYAEKTGYINYSMTINVAQSQTYTQNITMTVKSTSYFCVGTPTVTYAGKTYNTVQVGTQCWLKENLDVGVYVASTSTGSVHSDVSNNGTIEKYCYENNEANCATYGGLYDWNEAMAYSTTPGTKGICPTGWHIPTEAELETLMASVGNDGNKLKREDQGTGSGVGTNTSGFSALLAGYRNNNGYFYNLGDNTYFWSSNETFATSASNVSLWNGGSSIYMYSHYNKVYGFSIRCLKD